jgi:hypothetical protein
MTLKSLRCPLPYKVVHVAIGSHVWLRQPIKIKGTVFFPHPLVLVGDSIYKHINLVVRL